MASARNTTSTPSGISDKCKRRGVVICFFYSLCDVIRLQRYQKPRGRNKSKTAFSDLVMPRRPYLRQSQRYQKPRGRNKSKTAFSDLVMPRRTLSKTKSKIPKAESRNKPKTAFSDLVMLRRPYLRQSQRYQKNRTIGRTQRTEEIYRRERFCIFFGHNAYLSGKKMRFRFAVSVIFSYI